MSVYVDPMMGVVPNKKWKWKQACHLYADTLDELHAFAVVMGLNRSWFQNNPRLPHYDLTENMRRKAVAAGAVETDGRHLVEMMHRNDQRRSTVHLSTVAILGASIGGLYQ